MLEVVLDALSTWQSMSLHFVQFFSLQGGLAAVGCRKCPSGKEDDEMERDGAEGIKIC